MRVCACMCVCSAFLLLFYFLVILYVNCFGRAMLYMCIEYHILVNMYHERMINVHYYYYYCSCPVCAGRSHQDLMKLLQLSCLCRAARAEAAGGSVGSPHLTLRSGRSAALTCWPSCRTVKMLLPSRTLLTWNCTL